VWVHLPPKLLALLNPKRPARYRVPYGGRGGAKSWGIARGLIARSLERPTRVLCARELQGSIRESVHRLLSDQIEQLGLLPWFEIQQTVILGANNSEFIFEGVRSNPTKIKSMEGIDIAWLEEGEKVSDYSWSVLIPTVRKPGSEIWCSFNPDQEDDPTYVRFVKKPPPDSLIERMSWLDNPWFPAELERERAYLERVDPDAHAWIWRGECRAATDAQIFHGKFVVEEFEPSVQTPAQSAPDAPKPWSGPYLGADWGFSQDPTVLIKAWIQGRTLYIEHEAYGIGVDIDKTPALFDRVPGTRTVVIRADNARPETVRYMQQNGYPRTMSVEKWKGSVEDGIAFVRQFERVVIHPRCVHTLEEFRLYSYKVDRLSGDVLPDVVDAHNHVIDALRYALQPLIRAPNTGFLIFMQQEVDAMNARKAAEAQESASTSTPIPGARTVYGGEPVPSIPPFYRR
jgi:phage terminase large subunit